MALDILMVVNASLPDEFGSVFGRDLFKLAVQAGLEINHQVPVFHRWCNCRWDSYEFVY